MPMTTSRRSLVLAVFALALAACALSSCATTPPLHRGATQRQILDEVTRVVVEQGYVCEPTPARDVVHCYHERLYDLSFSYLPDSNYLHIYSSFDRRSDDGFADLWRGACADTFGHVNDVNANYISKVTCEGDFVFFVFYSWVPDNGLTDDDVRSLIEVVRTAITDAIHAGHMIRSDDEPPMRAPMGVPGAPDEGDDPREPTSL